MSEADNLADRVERATGPDRELDCLIAVAVNAGSLEGARKEMSNDEDVTRSGYVRHHYNGVKSLQEAKRYTASIDDAMSLLNGYAVLINLSEIGADGLAMARVGRPELDGAPIFEGIALGVMVDTPTTVQLAIALTAAALRARALTDPRR